MGFIKGMFEIIVKCFCVVSIGAFLRLGWVLGDFIIRFYSSLFKDLFRKR